MDATKISNIEKRKKDYRNRILEIIRQNEQASRMDIKRLSRFSMTTTLETVENMISDGLLIESGMGESTGGRKPTWLKINPEGGYFLGVEFNASYVFYVIVDLCSTVCFYGNKAIPQMDQHVDGVTAAVCACISEMIDKVPNRERILGIGLGVPGYVNIEKGAASSYAFIQGWDNVPIQQIISQQFNMNVYIENNVHAMALAYKWLEYNGVCDNLIFFAMRTGLRLGSIVRGSLMRGYNNNAGEIDHFKVNGSNRLCSCGQKGCLVTEASQGALLLKVQEGMIRGRFPYIASQCENGRTPNILDLIEGINHGDKDSIALMEETATYIGQMLSAVVFVSNPDLIVISTIFSQCGPSFLDQIEQIVRKNCWHHQLSGLSFSYTKYDIHIGAIGAASIVMQNEIGIIS